MNILVIGGSGHVSGAVVQAALSEGHKVWIITRGQRAIPEGVISLIADRYNHDAMRKIVIGQKISWDLVVDCICYEVPEIQLDIELFSDLATQYVFVSSDFVYNPLHRSFPQAAETDNFLTPEDKLTPYGTSKRLCELELMKEAKNGLNWTIVRPCHIYGPTSELGCLPMHSRDKNIIETLQSGSPVKLVGGGHFLQQPILVSDLAKTILSVVNNNNAMRRAFNTAGPDIIESWQYYKILADILGVELNVKEIPVQSYLAEHPEHIPFLCHRIYDLNPLRAAGLCVPSTSIQNGLSIHLQKLLACEHRIENKITNHRLGEL